MSTVDELGKYKKDDRIPCRYGTKCYQRNPTHLNKYKHPPNNRKRKENGEKAGAFSKKFKLGEQLQEESSSKGDKNESDGTNNEDEATETTSEELDNDIKSENEAIAKEADDVHSEMNEEKINESELQDADDECLDPKEFISQKFLVQFPGDFYAFWEFCKKLNSTKPTEALKKVGLTLVGPFDVLADNFKNVKKSSDEFLLHWRYYYDPPELFTVLKGDDKSGYHIGYFFDSPSEFPSLVVSNQGTKNGVFSKMGDNIFAAVGTYLDEKLKTGDPFMKMHIGKLFSSLKAEADKLNLTMTTISQTIKSREKKVVAKTFNKLGLVVPYDKKSELGYRALALSDKELMMLLDKLDKAPPEDKSKYLSDLQPVLTYANIALDECDFGTGVKLGWELMFHGTDSLNSTISRFLSNSYNLLQKDAFAKIAQAHMSNRKTGCNLSII